MSTTGHDERGWHVSLPTSDATMPSRRYSASADVLSSTPAGPVPLSDEQIRQCANVAHGRGPNTVGVVSDFALKFARAVIAEYERINGITPAQGEQP